MSVPFVDRLLAPIRDTGTRYTILAALTALPVLVLKWRDIAGAAAKLLLPLGSGFSIYSLAAAALIAAASVVRERRSRNRRTSLRLVRRAVFPARIFRSASTRADIGFMLLNTLAAGGMIGWALLSFPTVSAYTTRLLIDHLGTPPVPLMPPIASGLILTLIMFLAYEFAYWLDHFLSHHIPLLWEFHRVHHTAETLTPLTVFRVHPVETIKFYNIAIIVMAPASALAGYALGRPGHGITLDGTNVIVLALIFLTGHLQHSHVWIAFTGRLGRVLLSPAHHQLHHSTNPAHFGHNLGNALAIFDALAGTLMMPSLQREKLVFGVEPGLAEPHTVAGGLVTPFVRACRVLRLRNPQGGSEVKEVAYL